MKLGNYFEKFGISTSDVPIALISLKGTLWMTYAALFVVCYKFRPIQVISRLPSSKRFLIRLEKRYPERFDYWKGAYEKTTERFASNSYFRRIPNVLGLNPRIFTLSIVEAFFIYKLTLPITVPTQFWLVVSILKRRHKSKQNSINDVVEGSYGVYQNIDDLDQVDMTDSLTS